MTDDELFEHALDAAGGAYAPYSRFEVGAAVLLKDGRVLTGVNVENAAYPLGVCAEKSALVRAVAEGAAPGDVDAVAVTASPCGGCRQWLLEFRVERVLFPKDGALVTRTPEDLLPESFEL